MRGGRNLLTLFDWQEEALVKALPENSGTNSWFMAWEMSLGKTLVATEYAKRVGAEQTLVVMPLNTRVSWERTVKGQIPGMPVYRLSSDKKDITNFLKWNAGERGFYLIGWEYMRTGVTHGFQADLIIYDECHKLQNHNKSKQSTAAQRMKAHYKLALSGTPAANKPEGIFGTLAVLWPDKYKSLYNWIDEHWRTIRNGASIELVREVRAGSVMEDIPNISRELRKDHRDDLPERMPEIPIEYTLTPRQRKLYDQFADDSLAWVEDDEGEETFVSTSIPLVKDLRLSQVCLAVPSVTYAEREGIKYPVVSFAENAKSAVMDALKEVLESVNGETVLVFTTSAKLIPVAVKQLEKAGYKARAWYGETKQDDRDWMIENFGKEFQVMVASIAAIAEGVDGLQHVCHNEFWMDKHPTQYLNTQARMRLDRPGQTEPVQSWYCFAPGTVSESRLERLDEVQASLDSMIDYKDREVRFGD